MKIASRGSPSPAARSRMRVLIAAAALIAACAMPAYSQDAAGDGQDLPAADQTFVSGKDIVIYPPDSGASSFRFLPDGAPIPFDRSLVLSSAPGEDRAYLVQVSGGRDGQGAQVTGYLIDKRRPAAPKVLPAPGIYGETLAPELSSEEGAEVYWALVGPLGPATSFMKFDKDSRPSLALPSSGTATYTLIAYAVDAAGNRGYPASFVYRLAEPGLPAASPQASPPAIAKDPSLPKPLVDMERGYTELSLAIPQGATLLVDVDPASPPVSLDEFERISAEGGSARLRIPCPYGWSGNLEVFYGLLRDGAASFNPQSLQIRLSFPIDEQPLPATPEAPILVADVQGRGSYAAFPSYDGEIFVSIDGSEPKAYSSPIALGAEKRSVKLSWYGQDDSGQRSSVQVAALSLPEPPPLDVGLSGIGYGASINGDVTLRPLVPATIRYEIRLDGSAPPEPGPSSPLFGDSLSLSCPPGEERSVVLRYRTFAGDKGSEGRLLRFVLDKKPPEAPRAQDQISSFTDKSVSLVLVPGAGGKDVFAAISVDGALSPFAAVKAPIDLPGSASGPVSYVVRAYDVDAAGNRSQEMKPLSFTVDRSSVYVAVDGSDRGDGSPDRPFASLDAAFVAAIKAGKKNVNIRGAVSLRSGAALASDIGLTGGYSKLWAKDATLRGLVLIAVPAGQAALSQAGGTLSLRRVDLVADKAGTGALISVVDGSLSMVDSSISARGDGDVLLVSALRSKIECASSSLTASGGMSCTAFSSDSSAISISGCSLSARAGVRVFDAFDMDGGSLSLVDSLVESHADLGLNMLSLRSASLLVDRSQLKAEDGAGFLRLGSFKSVSGEFRNSKASVSWSGPGTLFEISEGGPAFRHDTIVAGTAKGSLRFFDAKGQLPQVWNSILECSAAGSELLRSDLVPGAGTLAADCVWGFSLLLSGALNTAELASLNALNADSALYSSKPIVSEPPERSFAAPIKSQAPLRPDSICVNAALPLGPGYETDFSGRRRPGPGKSGPDIGADESSG